MLPNLSGLKRQDREADRERGGGGRVPKLRETAAKAVYEDYYRKVSERAGVPQTHYKVPPLRKDVAQLVDDTVAKLADPYYEAQKAVIDTILEPFPLNKAFKKTFKDYVIYVRYMFAEETEEGVRNSENYWFQDRFACWNLNFENAIELGLGVRPLDFFEMFEGFSISLNDRGLTPSSHIYYFDHYIPRGMSRDTRDGRQTYNLTTLITLCALKQANMDSDDILAAAIVASRYENGASQGEASAEEITDLRRLVDAACAP